MRRRLLSIAALAVPAALAPAGIAAAANADVNAVNGTAANGNVNSWSPPSVSISPGDTVTWRFDGTHNVASSSPNWNFQTGNGQAPATFRFDAAGTYDFVCTIHPARDGNPGMTGSVYVGTAAPPPPADTGPAPYPNDRGAPTAYERGGRDRKDPRVRRVRARRIRNGARVRFRVSERSRVSVRLKRGGRTREARWVSAAGRHTVRVRDRRLRAGRYRVVVRAYDKAGNRSRARAARVRVR